jgi:3-oxoacyl-[acyl-carrier protein] reductase
MAEGKLAGRVALVTGAGRRAGIGFAVARQLLEHGADVLVHSWRDDDVAAVVEELGRVGPRVAHVEADLAEPDAPQRVVAEALERFGALDVLVANHARDSGYALETLTAEELDRTWAANARACVLLVQAFAAAHDDERGGGRVVLFTSGQHLGPMADELPYAISKGAIHQMTASLADALADRAITVNAVNPGPVDTGWPSDELREALRPAFPAGRWGRP